MLVGRAWSGFSLLKVSLIYYQLWYRQIAIYHSHFRQVP